MRFPDWLPVYGRQDYRGDCPPEVAEQVTFFQWLQRAHPALHRVAIHPRNEGKRTYQQARRHRLEGSLNRGASDIIIPAGRSLVVEMKRMDHTKSRWEPGQLEYLEAARRAGAFVGVALGWGAAAEAVEAWLHEHR